MLKNLQMMKTLTESSDTLIDGDLKVIVVAWNKKGRRETKLSRLLKLILHCCVV